MKNVALITGAANEVDNTIIWLAS